MKRPLNARLMGNKKPSGGFMRLFCVSIGVLTLLSISIAAHSQEAEPAIDAVQEQAADKAPSRPALPDIILFESSIGDVHFPHKKHQRMQCSRCHHQIHAKELDTPHKDYLSVSWIECQTCHSTESEFGDTYYKCSGCHHSEPENIVDETISSKVVTHQSCWKCHKTGTGVKASEECSFCHVKEEK